MNSYAVIGRIPDGEDSLLVIQAKTVDAAKREFRRQLHADEGVDAEGRRTLKRIHGTDVYVIGVIKGDNLSVEEWVP